jgi:hypothetical protein
MLGILLIVANLLLRKRLFNSYTRNSRHSTVHYSLPLRPLRYEIEGLLQRARNFTSSFLRVVRHFRIGRYHMCNGITTTVKYCCYVMILLCVLWSYIQWYSSSISVYILCLTDAVTSSLICMHYLICVTRCSHSLTLTLSVAAVAALGGGGGSAGNHHSDCERLQRPEKGGSDRPVQATASPAPTLLHSGLHPNQLYVALYGNA